MGLFDNQQIAVAFCSPHRKVRLPNGKFIVDTVTVDWHRHRSAMATGTNCNFIEWFCDGYEIGEARDQIARKCLAHEPRPKYLFWLDDDVLPGHDAFTKLLFRAETHPDYDVFAGVYACKGLCEPLIYAGSGVGPFWDWCIGDLLTTEGHGITGVHSGLTLVRVSLFQRMLEAGVVKEDEPFYKTVYEHGKGPGGNMQTRQGTEDLYFCQLAAKVNAKFLIDTSVLAGHIDKKTGITWGLPEDSPPVKRAKWLTRKDSKDKCPECDGKGHVFPGKILEPGGFDCKCEKCDGTGLLTTKIALDLGAGGSRREWPGHRTYTLDIRPETKPDYCQDLLKLNLPDNHFDLVASSHSFEHIGRWDQEKVWAEAYRVCKPGGSIEVIVPTIEWAAHKIVDGQCDAHTLDVLYGAQESHGYERIYNTHFFGYTKAIGIALAESVGFVDVTATDWRDDENVVYELTIKGRKPLPEGEVAKGAVPEGDVTKGE